MVHSEIMLLDIIELYIEVSQENSLELKKLEKAFYTLEELIGNHLGISVEYEFFQELEKLDQICEGVFEIDDDAITFHDDVLDHLEEQIIASFEGEYYDLDGDVADLVHNKGIYQDLEIKPNMKEYQEIFNTSLNITRDYQLLARQVAFKGKANPCMLLLIKSLIEHFEELYEGLQYDDVTKIKVILAYLNDKYLLNGEDDFLNSDWHIILFSKNEGQFTSLAYNRLLQFINREDAEYLDDYASDEEFISDEIFSCDPYLFDEVDFFLSYFVKYLHQYLKSVKNGEVKNILTTKEYLLIERENRSEEYFLEHGTIDDMPISQISENSITETSFNSLYLTVIDSICSLKKKDQVLNSMDQADMIVSALFIRTFLDLCINQEMKEDIIKRITNPIYYKNAEYQIASSLLDEIVFKEKGFQLNIKL